MLVVSALITWSSGNRHAGSASSPIASSETSGKRSLRVDVRERLEEHAVERGSVRHPREAEQVAVDRGERGDQDQHRHRDRRPAPKAFSTIVEATCGAGRRQAAVRVRHDRLPRDRASTPICITTYSAPTSRIEITIARGSVRAGSTHLVADRVRLAVARRSRTSR